jgi:hypothetical protein
MPNVRTASVMNELFRKHVGAGPVDLPRLHGVIRREKRAVQSGAIRATPGLLTELRSDLATVGRVLRLCPACLAQGRPTHTRNACPHHPAAR